MTKNNKYNTVEERELGREEGRGRGERRQMD